MLMFWDAQTGKVLQNTVEPPKPIKPASADDRISNLEKKLTEIMKELEGLRKEMKTQPGLKAKSAAFDGTGRILAIELVTPVEPVAPVAPKALIAPPAPVPPSPLPPRATPATVPNPLTPPVPVAPKKEVKGDGERSADGKFIKRVIELVTPADLDAPKVVEPPVPTTPAKR